MQMQSNHAASDERVRAWMSVDDACRGKNFLRLVLLDLALEEVYLKRPSFRQSRRLARGNYI